MELKKQVVIKWYERTLYNFYKEMDYKVKWIEKGFICLERNDN